MIQSRYHIKRLLARFNPKKLFNTVGDSRQAKKCTRTVGHTLEIVLQGFLSGIYTPRALESFSESKGSRIPYSSLSYIVGKASSNDLQRVLATKVKEAHREHHFSRSKTLPIFITSIDGKKTASAKSKMTEHFVDNGNGGFYCKAIRACLTSVETPVFLGQRMLQAEQGEADQAIPLIKTLIEHYGKMTLLHTFSFDAGFASKQNADFIHYNGYFYIQRIKGNQPILFALLDSYFEALVEKQAPLECEEVTQNSKTFIRELYRIPLGDEGIGSWEHAKEAWCVKSTYTNHLTGKTEITDKYYLSNHEPHVLTDLQVLLAVRTHWRIENNGFFTLDYTFEEDDYPLTNTAPEQVSLLRLLAYNLFAIGVKKKAPDRKRVLSVREIMNMIHAAFIRFDLEFPDRTCPAFI